MNTTTLHFFNHNSNFNPKKINEKINDYEIDQDRIDKIQLNYGPSIRMFYEEGTDKNNYEKEVNDYLSNYSVPLSSSIKSDIKKKIFFRKKFVKHLKDRLHLAKPHPPGNETSAIKMDQLFIPTLYELALKEEVNSMEFIQAVIDKSLTEYPGVKWNKKNGGNSSWSFWLWKIFCSKICC